MQTAVWGPHLWDLLHDIASGVQHTAGTLPRAVCGTVRAMRGILPCTYCRESFDEFIKLLELKFGKLEDLASALFPHFVFQLHELVNDKLDKQRAQDSMALIAREVQSSLTSSVTLSDAEVYKLLYDACLKSGAYRGRRISYDVWERRQFVSPHVLSPSNVIDVLFVLILNYPENPDNGVLPVTAGDKMGPREKRKLYWLWFQTLPDALQAAGMTCHFPDVLRQVWGACTRETCPAHVPPTLLKLRKIFMDQTTRQGYPSKQVMFSMVLAVHGIYKGDACMTDKRAWIALNTKLHQRYEQARANQDHPPEDSCANGVCYMNPLAAQAAKKLILTQATRSK